MANETLSGPRVNVSSASTEVADLGASCGVVLPDFDAYLACLGNLLPRNTSGSDLNHSSSIDGETHASPLVTFSKSFSAFVVTLYSLIFVVSLVGNFGVCYIVVRKSRMRSVTNFFLANQALSDVLMTVFNIPFVVAKQLTSLWAVGVVMCHLVDYMGVMSVYVSTFILTIIAIDRHRVLVHPLRPRITMYTAVIIAISIWVLACILAVPYAVFINVVTHNLDGMTGYTCIYTYPQDHWTTVENSVAWSTLLLQYVLPFIIIAASYVSIGRKLWSTRAVGDTMAAQQAASARRKIRTTRLLVLAVLVFGVCWLPLHIYLILTRYLAHYKHASTYLSCHWFAMCSACINPVAFCFLNESLRTDIRVTFSKLASRIRGTRHEGQHNQTLSLGANQQSVTHQSGWTSEGSPRRGQQRPADVKGNHGNVVAMAAMVGSRAPNTSHV
ncbi:prolactin-releasing peptide receptor-like [Diadema antillarum]|uniref:prolactin-releasing peptide receptor-like n=2 Tax=Diadema antillarum TaxID=105358 RepID=UPI003A8C0EC8